MTHRACCLPGVCALFSLGISFLCRSIPSPADAEVGVSPHFPAPEQAWLRNPVCKCRRPAARECSLRLWPFAHFVASSTSAQPLNSSSCCYDFLPSGRHAAITLASIPDAVTRQATCCSLHESSLSGLGLLLVVSPAATRRSLMSECTGRTPSLLGFSAMNGEERGSHDNIDYIDAQSPKYRYLAHLDLPTE